MTMKMRIGTILLLTMAGVAGAGQFRAGPMIGITQSGSTEDGIIVYGAQAEARLGNFSLELAAMHLTDEPEEERFGIRASVDEDILPVMLSIKFSHPLIPEKLEGYILGGLGWYFGESSNFDLTGHEAGRDVVVIGELEVDRDDAFGYHTAIGLEWYFTQRLSLLAEVRHAVMDTDATLSGLSARTPEGQQAIEAFERDFYDNNDMVMWRFGVNWRF